MASIRQTFPDVLYLGDNLYKLVTDDAISWVHFNTDMGRDIPRMLKINGDSDVTIANMEDEGIIVRRATGNRLWQQA